MKVVVVGGGFGGVRAALKLANKKNIEVKLIASQSYFEYHAALYRSATGRSPLEVTIPLRDFFEFAKNVEVVEDKIIELDNFMATLKGSSGAKYHYDQLILALGNVTEYYNIDGLDKFSFGVKTIHEALKLKRHLHEQLLQNKTDQHHVVIGAGATGVELAAELMAYIKKLRRKHNLKERFTLDLIESAPRILSTMPENYTKKITARLEKLGVSLQLNTSIQSEKVDSLKLPFGEIQSHTVIWTAGATNNPFYSQYPDVFKLNDKKRVVTDDYLSASTNIFVIGDSADTKYSGMAQTALYDANFVTNNLLRKVAGKPLIKYVAKKPIYAIPVGPRWAAVLWNKFQLFGRSGWVLRRLADLRLYLKFLPLRKALITWRYGFIDEEICRVCKQ